MSETATALRQQVRPLRGAADDFETLLGMVGDARFVLLGEASHGTHEFYRARAEITRRLLVEKGFSAVAVEADWPDAYRVNCFVRGTGTDRTANDALGEFRRFPTWMWRNVDVLDFVARLRSYNDMQTPPRKVGFYGLDLYSLYGSIRAVLAYLDKVDADAAARARYRYACFEQFGKDTQATVTPQASTSPNRANGRLSSNCLSSSVRRSTTRGVTGGWLKTSCSSQNRMLA